MTFKPNFLRTPNNYDRDAASNQHGLRCDDETLAQQQYRDEVDINNIAERYGLTGELPQVTDPLYYGDFHGIFDYQTAMNAVVAGREAFMTLPAKVRSRFDNNPQKLLEFLADEENRDEAIKLGILTKPQPAVTTGEPHAPRSTTPAPTATQNQASDPGTPRNPQPAPATKGPG